MIIVYPSTLPSFCLPHFPSRSIFLSLIRKEKASMITTKHDKKYNIIRRNKNFRIKFGHGSQR